MKKRMVIPKDNILPQLKETLVPHLGKEMKKNGIYNFRYIDMEWGEEGVIIYYEESGSKGPK